jgi:hypothetical protein
MTTPSAREVLDRILADQRGELHTSFPAQVIAYDVDAQTVDVRPALLREIGSDEPAEPWGFEQLPDLLSVQVMWPRAGGFVVTFPIQPGDWVLVICAEQSTLLWRASGGTGVHPGLVDPHGLNGCVCLPGWVPDTDKLANVSTTDLVLGKTDGSATIKIKADGTVTLGSDAGAQALALAHLVDARLQRLQAAFDVHVHATAATGTPSPPIPPAAPPLPPGVTIPVGSLASVAATKVRGV